MAASTPTFVSGTPTASPDLLRHAHCHTCATEGATGAARATRMPARLLAQLAGTWLKSHRSSAPRTPQPAALTWRGKTAKIPAVKAVLGLPSARLLRRAKRDVFCVSQPNFPRCLASSRARLLPPAFVFLPGARREGTTPGSAAGRARTGAGPSSTSPRCTPPVTPAAPQELSILVLGKQQEGACLQHRRARRRREPSVRTRGKVCSFSERLSCVSPSTSRAPSASLPGRGNAPFRNSPAVLSHTSAVRLQLRKTAPSRRVRLVLRRRDGAQQQSFRTRAAGGERDSPPRSGRVRQLGLLCSTLGSGGASPPQSFYLGAPDMPFDLLRATIPQQANQPRAASSLEARSCGRSEISQGITSKAPSDNLPDAVQAQLFSARNSNYSFVQLLYMGFSKSRDKIPLLKTRMVYLRHPQRVTRGRRACKDLLPPLGFSPVLFASRWADQALVGCRNSIARTWLTRAFKEKLSKMERTKWGSCCRFPSCSKRHTSAELAVPAAACDESQEGLQGSYRHGRAGVPHHKTKPQPSHRMGPQGGPGQLYSPAGQLSAPTASRGCPAGWHWPLSRGALCQAFPAPDLLSREDGLQQASCSCG